MVLLGISPLLSPDLLDALYRMGHGDEIILADAHFPAESICAKSSNGAAVRLVRADGISVPQLLQAILPLFPLDRFVPFPLAMMEKVEGDTTDVQLTIDLYGAAVETK